MSYNRFVFSPHGELNLLGVHELCFQPNRTEVFCFGVHIDGEHRLLAFLTRTAPDRELDRVGVGKRQGHAEQDFLLRLGLHGFHLIGFDVVDCLGEFFHQARIRFVVGAIQVNFCNEFSQQLFGIECGRWQASGQPNLRAHGAHHGLPEHARCELRHGQLQTAPLRLQIGALNLA